MENQQSGVSPHSVNLSKSVLKQMISVVHGLQQLSEIPDYSNALIDLQHNAQVSSKNYSVLMGYDFHITDTQQVKLIEVNTNAGGLWFASQSYRPHAQQFPEKLANTLLQMFLAEYRLFCQDENALPKLIAIVDQEPEEQFLFAEMQVFAKLFQQQGIETIIVDPKAIETTERGLFFQGKKIDLIYNRHCDFYLNSVEMAGIAKAWQQQSICLTPNPRVYGLLADKRRMVDWSVNGFLNEFLTQKQEKCLQQAIPDTHLLQSFSKDALWRERKKWVFKPANSYASRGVYVGEKLTKTKYNGFESTTTLVQQRIKPLQTVIEDGRKFKTDFRLFVYRKKMLAVSARLYQGQVTNLRTPEGGFCKVQIN